MKTRIIIDSTVDLPAQLRQQVVVVPLRVLFGEEEFIDGVTITSQEFYQRLAACDTLPTTSMPSPDDFYRVYEEVTRDGSQAVVITISSKLSGTYQGACIAAEDFPNVRVVDSRSATIGSGVLAELALRLADQGLSAGEIAQQLEAERSRVHIIALFDTLEYLKKGGRLSATAALAGSLLSVKPLIHLPDGEIATLGKARGNRRGNEMLLAEIEKAGGVDFDMPVLQGYTGNDNELQAKFLADSAATWEGNPQALRTVPICSVIGTHAGPNAYAAAFFHKL